MSTEVKQPVRFGILGAGRIAHDLVKDLRFTNEAKAIAVGSRSQQSAQAFADTYDLPYAHGSYEELVQNPEVDVIYVATPHTFHAAHALLAIEAGKAVLCEKPFTVNAAELQKVIEAARSRRVFVMEAMWSRYVPVLQKVKAWVDEGKIGELLMLKADFGFQTPKDPKGRLFDRSLGGGALLDIGIYPVSFASFLFGKEPNAIKSCVHLGDTGVDEQFSLLFSYENGATAVLSGAIRLTLRNEATLYGKKGSIYIPEPFYAAKKAIITYYDGGSEEITDSSTCHGYVYEAAEVKRCLDEGRWESPVMPLQESLAIMQTLDRIRADWGLTYPNEEEPHR